MKDIQTFKKRVEFLAWEISRSKYRQPTAEGDYLLAQRWIRDTGLGYNNSLFDFVRDVELRAYWAKGRYPIDDFMRGWLLNLEHTKFYSAKKSNNFSFYFTPLTRHKDHELCCGELTKLAMRSQTKFLIFTSLWDMMELLERMVKSDTSAVFIVDTSSMHSFQQVSRQLDLLDEKGLYYRIDPKLLGTYTPPPGRSESLFPDLVEFNPLAISHACQIDLFVH